MHDVPDGDTSLVSAVVDRLRRAEDADDETRLAELEDVYETLNVELDRDVDQAASPGR